MLQQSCGMIDKFNLKVLSHIWGEYHLLVWNLNKNFSSFTGKEIKMLIVNIPNILNFLNSNFQNNDHLSNICNALCCWHEICPFLSKASVENKSAHENELVKFGENVKLFYHYGSKTFLTKNNVGDLETFYMHTLRFYMHPIAQETYAFHGLGLGVFTMQGFERRNKESKNTLRRFSNHRGNVVVPNMKRVFDIFEHGITAV